MLFKKAYRSIWENKKAYLACVLLIAVGILLFTSMLVAVTALDKSKDKYFAESNMADVFIKLGAIPSADIDALTDVTGVSQALGRHVHDSIVEIEGNDIATLRLISHDPEKEDSLNEYVIVEGDPISSPEDILVGQDFLQANGYKVGDVLKITIEGVEYDFRICGAVLSPEYIYSIKDEKTAIPDPKTFSFAYVDEDALGKAINREGVYNDVSLVLEAGYEYEDIKTDIYEAIDEYGVISMVPLEDQLSYAMLKNEIESNKSFSISVAIVFSSIASIVLYLMLKRVIEQERTQIGTLKAFGYSNVKLLLHYLCYGGITGVLGGLLGGIAGFALSESFIDMYKSFYRMPEMIREGGGIFFVIGMVIAISGGVIGSLMGAKNILKLSPAEAMRPVAPKPIKKDVLRKMPFIKVLLNSGGSMAIRSIERNKLRSFFAVMGIMFSFGLISMTASFTSMIDLMLFDQFDNIQLYDMKVAFDTPVKYDDGVQSVASIDGVSEAQGLLEIPVKFKHNHREEGALITGIPPDSQLYKIYDSDEQVSVPPPKNGVIINNALAGALEVDVGDVIYVSSPLLDEDKEVVVYDIVAQYLGKSSYMDIDSLNDFFNLNDVATSVMFNTDDVDYAKEFLLDANNVAAVEDKGKIVGNYRALFEPYTFMMLIFEVVAMVIAFAIIYNISTISLAERKREYATLRVLGLQVSEVAEIISFEYWIFCVVGMVLGVPFTMFLKISMAQSIEVDLFTIPVTSPLSAYIIGAIGCIVAVFLANRVAKKNVRNFDMVEVLKERE